VSSEANIIDLHLEKKNYKCVIREVQYDPVLGHPLHVDFMGIRLDEKIHFTVPLHLVGTPEGVKEGGILQQILREVEVLALPLEIPEHIDIDVSALNIGDSIHISEIKVEKIDVLTDLERSIATVSAPTIVKEPEPEELEEVLEGEEVEAEEGEAPDEEPGKEQAEE
jgi:large subunit ribosomal protein L25